MASALSQRDKLLAQQAKITERLKALDAKDRAKTRKEETRRKIIVGSIIMEAIEKDPALRAQLLPIISNGVIERDKPLMADVLKSPQDKGASPQSS